MSGEACRALAESDDTNFVWGLKIWQMKRINVSDRVRPLAAVTVTQRARQPEGKGDGRAVAKGQKDEGGKRTTWNRCGRMAIREQGRIGKKEEKKYKEIGEKRREKQSKIKQKLQKARTSSRNKKIKQTRYKYTILKENRSKQGNSSKYILHLKKGTCSLC